MRNLMRPCRRWPGLLVLASVIGAGPGNVSAQDRGALSFTELDEVYVLDRMVDVVADGQPAGGDAWLKLSHHLLRGDRGRVYVPFTVTIDEAPGRFRSVSLYVRLANRGEDASAGKKRAARQRITGFEPGTLPVFIPERATSATAPPGTLLAGENSTAMRLATDTTADEPRYPFEDVHFIDFTEISAEEPYRARRALVVAPGEYDLYVAVREYDLSGDQPSERRSAVLKRPISIPAFSPTDLTMSSLILADQIRALDAPVPAAERSGRPYAFGAAQVTPAADPIFNAAETLSVVFFIYNLATDDDGRPNATVRYRMHQQVGAGEEFFGQTAPTEFNPETLPDGFDYEAAGRQLFTSQMLPLGKVPAGSYRLEVLVTDNLADRRTARNLQFIVHTDSQR